MIVAIVLIAVALFVGSQYAWIKWNGSPVAVPGIPRGGQTLGQANDTPLTYIVLGDSTTISQGGDYKTGYAVASAEHVAGSRRVTWHNLGTSGARVADVLREQIPDAVALRPRLVLIAAGANDVTHLTGTKEARRSLESAVARLRAANPDVRIVLTGSPDMGSIPRLPQPSRWLAGVRTEQFNSMVRSLCASANLTFAPIAEKTGPAFRRDRSLFAADNFHPNAKGYALWTPVITEALDVALLQK